MAMLDAKDLAPTAEELAAEAAEEAAKSRVPKNESPEDKFIRIAAYRENKIIDDIRKLRNLKSGNYKSTLPQRLDIVTNIRRELDRLETHYAGDKD